MGTSLCLLFVIDGAAGQYLHLEVDVLIQNLTESQDARLLLVVYQRQHDYGEGGLELGLDEQAVQDHLRVGVLFQLDDDAHTLSVRLVPQAGNAFQPLGVDLLGDIFNQASLIDLIGQLRNDDAGAASAELLHLRLCPNGDLPSAGAIGGTDAATAHDDAAGGEIGSLDVLHQIV